MRLRISSKISLPWDNSSDSFYSNSDSEDINTNAPQNTIDPNPVNQVNPPNANPYNIPPSQLSRPNLLTTLRLWVLPNPPDLPNHTSQIVIPIPTTIKIEEHPRIPQANQPNHYQTALNSPGNNHHWGDPMISPKLLNTLWVFSRNVNTLSMKSNYLQWRAASQAIFESEADAVALQETNLSWNKIHKKCIQQIFQMPTGQAILATTQSTEISADSYQWGGTLQAIIGRWTPHAIQQGQDTSGMGRWSFIELQGKDNKRYIIASGYRVGVNQKFDLGLNNTYNQQYRILHQ